MQVLITAIGISLLAVVLWCRLGQSERARWWTGDRVHENAVLFWLPGLGLILLAAGPLMTYDGANRGVLSFVPLVLLGGLLSLWGGLFLPVPRWYTPRWTRSETTTILQNRVLGLRNRKG
ncbi:MAG: hypothetical protein L0H79_12960 [Intrasporangium sp.]|uniref:hypothetical protein n=1 Tax=Intrasporangium sp. TaxID=1925024 RepID=UPI00264A2F0B|nr:hypothetical protein [Intrasporangium sp.]MDN5796651.1 hypothetical protein [Intrasporangium sp.]